MPNPQEYIEALARPEASTYHPTWRDYISSLLMGDAPPSPMRREFVEGLTGSSGLGTKGTGLVDLTPVGAGLRVQENLQQDRPGMAALNAAGSLAMTPIGRTLMQGASNAVKAAPGLAASLVGGLAAATPTPAGAEPASAATPTATGGNQGYMVPMPPQVDPTSPFYRRPRTVSERAMHEGIIREWQASEARARAEQALQAGQKSQALELSAQADQQRQTAETRAAQEATRKAGAPFIEQHPEFQYAVPVGAMVSALLPAWSKAVSQAASNAFNKRYQAAADEAKAALASGNKGVSNIMQHVLDAYSKVKPPQVGANPWVTGAAALAPAELAGLPTQIDLLRPKGTRAYQEAAQDIQDPMWWAKRVGPQALTGASAATLGSHLPAAWPRVEPPTAQAQGILKALKRKKSD